MKRAVLLIISVLIFIPFPVNSFAEEEENKPEPNWELKYWQAQKELQEAYITSNQLLSNNSMLKIELLKIRIKEIERKIEKIKNKQEKDGEEKDDG